MILKHNSLLTQYNKEKNRYHRDNIKFPEKQFDKAFQNCNKFLESLKIKASGLSFSFGACIDIDIKIGHKKAALCLYPSKKYCYIYINTENKNGYEQFVAKLKYENR
jgi:hypothetical protein